MKTKRKTTAKKTPARKPAPKKSARRKKPRFPLKYWILPAIGLVGVIYGVSRLVGDATGEQYDAKHRPIEERKASTRAKIIESIRKRKGISVHYQFSFKGSLYDNWQSDYNKDFQLHHCYQVDLDSSNPARSFLVGGTEGSCGDL